MEHYVTLFDSNFLPSGLCLHDSLTRHAADFTLWVVCMDKKVEVQLRALDLPYTKLISIEDAENERLLSIKESRNKGEYCWTMTPFTPELVFKHAPHAQRVTYLDADLFFFDDPKSFFDEFNISNKHVLITEHAYAPEYEKSSKLSGRFCVQFMTFRRTKEAAEVMHWWQDRCLEWCYARFENGLFGDQKYLDSWPQLFEDKIHILSLTSRTLAPWNVRHWLEIDRKNITPVFYHFHSFRIISSKKIKLYEDYFIGEKAHILYSQYLETLIKKLQLMISSGFRVPVLHESNTFFGRIMNVRNSFYKTRKIIKFNL